MLEFYSDFIDESQLQIIFNENQILLQPNRPKDASDKWKFIEQKKPQVDK